MAPAVCSVCNDDSTPPTCTYPTCCLPYHTRFLSKQMNAMCKKCQKTETPETLPPQTLQPETSTSAVLADNISTSNRLLKANKLLLDEKSILRDELRQTQQLLKKLYRACRDIDTGSMSASDCGPMLASGPCIIEREATKVVVAQKCSCPRMAPTGDGTGSRGGGAEGCEVIIHKLIQDGNNVNEKVSDKAAFALLSTVLRALQKSDIVSTPVLRRHRSDRAQKNNTIATNWETRRSLLLSVVVKLASPGLLSIYHSRHLVPSPRAAFLSGWLASFLACWLDDGRLLDRERLPRLQRWMANSLGAAVQIGNNNW
ncbi:hypothetical protein TSAR_007546 [Trichomalopsis sarcophagae]|uniref:Uncharacterized protein n=1 Tax=Trichomalopsis sarcophagae TaxID=543379 RepID=A0A232ESZ7_9HYME|nr:hypothetical protein TSAR_007546 [Trichomalopsis sarcophagae]